MDEQNLSTDQVRMAVIQQLEGLRRAGVTHWKRIDPIEPPKSVVKPQAPTQSSAPQILKGNPPERSTSTTVSAVAANTDSQSHRPVELESPAFGRTYCRIGSARCSGEKLHSVSGTRFHSNTNSIWRGKPRGKDRVCWRSTRCRRRCSGRTVRRTSRAAFERYYQSLPFATGRYLHLQRSSMSSARQSITRSG